MPTLQILGSCSGTEPMPNRLHTSLVLQAGDRNYFFDAGEACSRTAYLSDVDPLRTRAIFISHTHFDHIGGLMGLLWCTHKMITRSGRPLLDQKIKLYIPDLPAWDHLQKLLLYTEGSYDYNNIVEAQTPALGTFFDDGVVKVTGFPTRHLQPAADGHLRSFSYRIEAQGKTVVFSGDVKDMEDLVPVCDGGCDLLLCETGHHRVEDVCTFAQQNAKELVLLHHGREILENRDTVSPALSACSIPVSIADDGWTTAW